MSLFDELTFRMLNGKRTITKPIFIKDFTKDSLQLKQMLELSNRIKNEEKKGLILRDINFLKSGLEGESNVYYEIKNSFLPLLCLHDIRLEYKDYVAQFDFIIITRKSIIVLETKKLNGDIEITSDGDFIRLFKNNFGKVYKKEGMYSPVSQNERHVKILQEVLRNNGIIKTMPIKSGVVMANPKTIVNKSKCPKDIMNNIYKYDQVAKLIKKELEDTSNERDLMEKQLYSIAKFLIDNHKTITFNFEAKYSLEDNDYRDFTDKERAVVSKNDKTLIEALKKYRLKVSNEENIKAYMVFNNTEMEDLIDKKPKSKTDLLKVKGFGNKKAEKYGDEILKILNASGGSINSM